jgi:hypothetical protein
MATEFINPLLPWDQLSQLTLNIPHDSRRSFEFQKFVSRMFHIFSWADILLSRNVVPVRSRRKVTRSESEDIEKY